jgi:hypothetical protein
MTRAEEYMFKAAELVALAQEELDPKLKSGFQSLADRCMRLAAELDEDSNSDRPASSH